MTNSSRFRALRTRIRQLRRHFLPRRFDATGTYSDRQFDHARAFRLLAHAEFEGYLEDAVFDTANKAFRAWYEHGIITVPLMAMLAYSGKGVGVTPPNMQKKNDLVARVQQSRDTFNRYTKARNHGIRESDVLKLLRPVGISEQDLDATWLSTTNSFARSRGETAHRSNRVTRPPDPRNEFDIVNQILDGLSEIDKRLLELSPT